MNYEDTGNELVKRILELIPKHPEILNMTNAWDLFKIEEFECDDLEQSWAQASWALDQAKRDYEEA